MDIRAFMIYTVNHQTDLREYRSNPLINKTFVNDVYGLNHSDYPAYLRENMNRTKFNYKEAISSVTMHLSDVISE